MRPLSSLLILSPLAALLALTGCGDSGASANTAAADAGIACNGAAASCEGNVITYCDEAGLSQRLDCTADGRACLHGADGRAYCGQPCPAGADTLGTCTAAHLTKCDGEVLVDLDCGAKSPAQACARDAAGIAWCTDPIPADVDALGRCEGTRLTKRDGDVLRDYDCAEATPPALCARDAAGEAFCTQPVPSGLTEAGECVGTRLRARDGERLIDYDCSAADPDRICAVDAQGVAQCTVPCPSGLDALGGCSGTRLSKCSGGVLVDLDCAAREPALACGRDAAGEAFCGAPAPAELTSGGVCVGNVRHRRDGELVEDTDCAALDPARTCALDALGDAYCTLELPAEVTEDGQCDGTRLRRRSGDVLIDLDCSASGRHCATTAAGRAFCTAFCPAGLDASGRCDGDTVRSCDGDVFIEVDCAARGQTCRVASRFGAACVGCGDTPPGGVCSPDGVLTACTPQGTSFRENCAADGRTCGWDATACAYACLPARADSCEGYGLAEGEYTCWKANATGHLSVVHCQDGAAVAQECPAASDASVGCTEAAEATRCTTTCNASGRRCTDRGVLVTCDDTPTLGWVDCGVYGATCVETDDDAYCACAGVPATAAGCSEGRQAACTDGRLVMSACTCPSP